MKKENIYLHLSKLSGEQVKEVEILTENPILNGIVGNPIFHYAYNDWEEKKMWFNFSESFVDKKYKKTEITLSEFRQLFSSEEVLQGENNGWISVKDRLPNKGENVLIFRDVRKWDEKRIPHIDFAQVGYLEKDTLIGGPNSLTGYSRMQGIYFAVPAILHPESVSHWMPLPEPPKF